MRKVGPAGSTTGKMWRVFTSLSGKRISGHIWLWKWIVSQVQTPEQAPYFETCTVIVRSGLDLDRNILEKIKDASSRVITSSPTLASCKTAWSSHWEKKTFQIWKPCEFINTYIRYLGPITSTTLSRLMFSCSSWYFAIFFALALFFALKTRAKKANQRAKHNCNLVWYTLFMTEDR